MLLRQSFARPWQQQASEMSASEEIQPSQCTQDHEEMYEEEVVDEDVSTTTYPSFHLERPSPGRFASRPQKNPDDDEDDDHNSHDDEDGARVLQPTRRKRPTPPSSLDLVASSSGSLHVKKQPLLRDPSASNLLKKRAKKQNLQMFGDDEYGADDTEILLESSADGKSLSSGHRCPKHLHYSASLLICQERILGCILATMMKAMDSYHGRHH